jgi:predicted RNase H-like HicB family nuclease
MGDTDGDEAAQRSDRDRAMHEAQLFGAMSVDQRLAVLELVRREVDRALAGRAPVSDPSDDEFWRVWRDPNWSRRADREDALSEALERTAAPPSPVATLSTCTLGIEASLKIELDREADGRWIAVALELPGVLVYGKTRDEALRSVEVLALRALADRIEHREAVPRSVRLSVGH